MGQRSFLYSHAVKIAMAKGSAFGYTGAGQDFVFRTWLAHPLTFYVVLTWSGTFWHSARSSRGGRMAGLFINRHDWITWQEVVCCGCCCLDYVCPRTSHWELTGQRHHGHGHLQQAQTVYYVAHMNIVVSRPWRAHPVQWPCAVTVCVLCPFCACRPGEVYSPGTQYVNNNKYMAAILDWYRS